MAHTPPPEDHENEDLISIVDVITFFTENVWFLVRGAAVGIVAGFLYVGLMPPSFKAVAQIQMATVNGTPVETPAVLVEKMKLPLYFSEHTWLTCDSNDNLHPSRTLAKKLQPTVNRNAPFVSISLISDSPGKATACINSVFKDIQSKQAEIAEPMIKFGEANLHSLKNRRAQAEEFLQLLPKIKIGTDFSDSKFPAMALLSSTLMAKESELRELQFEIAEAELRLAVPNTQGTALVAKVFAPDTPDGPAWWLILVLTSLSGLLIAIAFLLIRKGLQKGTTQAASEI